MQCRRLAGPFIWLIVIGFREYVYLQYAFYFRDLFFPPQVVLGMIQSCRSLGYIGEAIVLSQFLPSEATAFQLIEELRCSSDPASGAFDCLDGVAGTYLWNLNVLQGLTNLYQLKKSFSKRSTFLRKSF